MIYFKRRLIRQGEQKIEELKMSGSERARKHGEQLERLKRRNHEAVEKLGLQIEAQQATRDFNLGTSLKSYIDPRIYYAWGNKVNFDWKKYYPSTLQKKFSWIESADVSASDSASK